MARKAIVIGGGWAGCSAAERLSRAGWKVALFEKSSKLGGRASTFHHPKGWALDNGQHLFLGAYAETRKLLGTLGTLDQVVFQPRLKVPFFLPQGRTEVLESGSGFGPWGLWQGVKACAWFSETERQSFLRFGTRSGLELAWSALTRPLRLEGLTVSDWLDESEQPEDIKRKFWEPLCLAALNGGTGEVQASALATVLSRGFLRGGEKSGLGFSKVPLSRLVEPLAAWLTGKGGELHLEEGVARLVVDLGRVVGLETESGKRFSADAYVLALPHSLAHSLLPPEWSRGLGLEALKDWPCSPILSVQVFTQVPILPESFGAFSIPEGQADFHWAFDRNRICAKPEWPGHLTSFVSSACGTLAGLPREAVLDKLYQQLESAFPTFKRSLVTDALVLKEMRATPLLKPGSASLRLTQATLLKNLALAGDWTDTGLPATIEGAVVSGARAAAVLA